MESNETNQNPEQWEKKFLQELAMSSLVEKRRTRRWGIFFKTITAVYLFVFLMLLVGLMAPGEFQEAGIKKQAPHTALVNVSGIIMDETEASADNVVTGLRNAFKNKHTKGVIIRINSPGGTPVQAGYINAEILRLKEKYPDIPVYAVVSDVAASGGYYVAVAADEIYVDKASIVGSIGVLMNGFGFVDGMEKLGVERRLFTAGEHKGINDPFSPVTEFDREHVQVLLDQMHQQFIDAVKKGRGDRLQSDDKIFSGLYWTGEESIKLGLADGLGSSSYVARELIKEEEIVDYTPAEDLLERFARKMGASTGQTLSRIWGFSAVPLPR
jgi:protease-4